MPSNRSNKPTPKAPPPHASDRARIVAGVLALAIYTAGVVLLMLGLGNGGLVFAACCLIKMRVKPRPSGRGRKARAPQVPLAM